MTERASKAAHSFDLGRMRGLETAAEMLGGHEHLADALSIGVRALRAKFAAERGITYTDLTCAASVLRQRATLISLHAAKLDALAADPRQASDATEAGA